jgi:hypothetical protein
MVDTRLLSRCGIYCGACYVYRAERDGGILLDEMSKRFGVPREKIRCNGCSSLSEEQWPNCQKCAFKACQKQRGVENCAQCPEYDSCSDYRRLADFTAYRGEDIRAGLKKIEAGEGEVWLREQEKLWTCPRCDYPLTWYDNVCRECDWKLREKPVTMDGYPEK